MTSAHSPETKEKEDSTTHSLSSEGAAEEAQVKAETKDKANVHNQDAVPNGGLKAWLQVAGAFFLLFNCW